jgi:hypothetical protein
LVSPECLDAHQELVVAIDARRRRDHDASGGAVDRNHRPRGGRRSGQQQQGEDGENGSFHGPPSYVGLANGPTVQQANKA